MLRCFGRLTLPWGEIRFCKFLVNFEKKSKIMDFKKAIEAKLTSEMTLYLKQRTCVHNQQKKNSTIVHYSKF